MLTFISDHRTKLYLKHFFASVKSNSVISCQTMYITLHLIQSCLQMMRLQRRLYVIYSVFILIFMIPLGRCKLIYFFVKSSLSFEELYLMSYRLPLKAYPLQITIYFVCFFRDWGTQLQTHVLPFNNCS